MIRQHNLPACPDSLQIRHYIAYPSAVIVFILIALLSLLFAVLVGFKYNSVKIFNRKIRRENISNTTWIMYYMVVAIRAAFLSVEFAWDISSEAQQIVSVLTLVLHGGVVLMLEFALNHQRRYRSYSSID
jgi:undecaprenyl pyrophosphate phosphatase UppP